MGTQTLHLDYSLYWVNDHQSARVFLCHLLEPAQFVGAIREFGSSSFEMPETVALVSGVLTRTARQRVETFSEKQGEYHLVDNRTGEAVNTVFVHEAKREDPVLLPLR